MRKTRKEVAGKYYSARGVELTRCSGWMTEAEYYSWILSNARRLTLRWRPRNEALARSRRIYKGSDKRIKWEYQCQICAEWVIRKEIEVDHIVPCGGIKCLADIPRWYTNALCEIDGFEVLCKSCHRLKTNKEMQ